MGDRVPPPESIYRSHKEFTPPNDPSTPIWRYCDLPKLVSMLDKSALHLSLAAVLEDQYEGGLSTILLPRQGVIEGSPVDPRSNPDLRDYLIEHHERARYTTFINSWHMNEYESAAMWRLYSAADQGIAIRSTFSRLTQSMSRIDDLRPDKVEGVYAGTVTYIDYSTEGFRPESQFTPYLFKRKSFEHEREVRLICRIPENLDWSPYPIPQRPDKVNRWGVLVTVDLDLLIDEIYISPLSPKFLKDAVQAVCDRFGVPKRITQSRLTDAPKYTLRGLRALVRNLS